MELVLKTRPEYILLDLIISELDGIAVLQKLYERTEDYLPKVVVTSMLPDGRFTQHLEALGCRLIEKRPFDVQKLADKILLLTMIPQERVSRIILQVGVPASIKGCLLYTSDWRLRQDERVVVMERCNARAMEKDWFQDALELAVMDVSFISIKLILPALVKCLEPGAQPVSYTHLI